MLNSTFLLSASGLTREKVHCFGSVAFMVQPFGTATRNPQSLLINRFDCAVAEIVVATSKISREMVESLIEKHSSSSNFRDIQSTPLQKRKTFSHSALARASADSWVTSRPD